jgi:hypothetical protein
VYGEPLTDSNANWFLAQTLCYLTHLELAGQITRESDGDLERWRVT